MSRLGFRSLVALIAALLLATVLLAGCGSGTDETSSTTKTTASGQGTEQKIPDGDWPYFGRIPERVHSLADAPDPPLRVRWQFFARQLIEFPPVITGGRLMIVNKAGEVYALKTTTGKVDWKRNLPNDVTGPALSTDSVFAASFDGTLEALDVANGRTRWKVHLPSHLESSPLVVGDTLYVGSDGGDLYALDARNGKPRWHAELGAPVKASPSLHSGTVYVGDYTGTIHALRASDGKQVWSRDTGGSAGFYASPSIGFGRLIEGRTDGAVIALGLDGKPAWRFQAGQAIYGSTALSDVKHAGPTAFIGSYDRNLYALRPENGKVRWKRNIGGQIPGSPTVLGNTVYTSSFQTKRTTGFDAASGRKVFTWGSAGYEPTMSDGPRVYLTGFQTIWAFLPKHPQR